MKPVVLLPLLILMLPAAHASTPNEDVPLYAASLVGSAYRLGGTAPETGLDCSGLVDHVFRQITGTRLPHDSHALSEALQQLAPDELQPGDLVFFNTLNRSFSHVGIYLGEDRFVHASSSRTGSVKISRLSDPYWHQRFDGARRVDASSPARPPDAVFQ
jgi:cell wall-associated NlpC family hydrolase